eukprot:CAMPEP_0201575770 /NCGR_PEP_ID=MMETSP0190_2-20130828/21183_1 /ASSEMBLY_ACC=CAM_ASM_000263 /TAXON_ID=37353 /ORGANISM="Rosalina sp." /LENGTH=178 /DNA_ID=CAMNT_0048005815 /DNA_START=73 /DNA_END=606 /DNA_ORIENTATION=-
MITAILILLSIPSFTNGHVRFRCPGPRSCFYGIDLDNSNGDGVWRQDPCGHDPVDPVVTYSSGSSICLRVHEFVPHPGYFEIYLSEMAVGPDTNDNDANWITLADNIPDVTEDEITTGIQAFDVTLPPNITCDHCTIQVKQWASDFEWYYYTCTDIQIVADDVSIDNIDTCVGNDSEW